MERLLVCEVVRAVASILPDPCGGGGRAAGRSLPAGDVGALAGRPAADYGRAGLTEAELAGTWTEQLDRWFAQAAS
jgi:hypothetical protein